MPEQQELTPEQYRVEVLKQRFARRTSDLEDECATVLTQLAQVTQERDALKEQLDAKEAEETESPANEAD